MGAGGSVPFFPGLLVTREGEFFCFLPLHLFIRLRNEEGVLLLLLLLLLVAALHPPLKPSGWASGPIPSF